MTDNQKAQARDVWPPPKLLSREHDDDCGCPEEYWEVFGLNIHMHLNTGKPSNAHADGGDWGEAEIEVTASSHDLARAAILGWAEALAAPPPPASPTQDALVERLREAPWTEWAKSLLDVMREFTGERYDEIDLPEELRTWFGGYRWELEHAAALTPSEPQESGQ